MKFEVKKISDIDCVFAPMDVNSTTIEIWVRAGSTYETKKENWISHFIEHMFFKWWEKYKTAKDVTEAIDNVGWEFNAYTWREHTWYYVKVAPEYIDLAIDVLSDMLVNANFDKNEIEKEKQVIIQELKMNQDNPHKVLINNFFKFYYWDNAYGQSVIWTEKNILSFTQQDLFNYKNSLYTKDNLVIAIAWKIEDQKRLEKLIEKSFKDLPSKKTKSKQKFLGIQAKEKIWYFNKNLEQNHLIIWIPGFSIFDERRYFISILATILWGNMSSILFQELREKLGLCYYISSAHYSSEEDGLFMIRAGLDKQNFQKWVDKINDILDEIVSGNISQEQLDKAKSYLLWKIKMGIETSDEMTNYILGDYLSLWKVETIDDYVKKINEISLDDIKQVVKFLSKENRYLYYLV
jgi:predicted Zn-dependent peptidase